MRKANAVFEKTKDRGLRLIVAADQNVVFEDIMYGKPKNKREAKKLISKMRGSDQIFACTGNAILLAEKDKILQSINVTDVARISVDNISDEEIDYYVDNSNSLSFCGGLSITNSNFVHLKEGRMSTTKGMTLEYAEEMLQSLRQPQSKEREKQLIKK